MWTAIRSTVVDIGKKLLVTVLAAPIMVVATKYIGGTIVIAAFSYSDEWYVEYWYLVLLAGLVGLVELCLLYKTPSAFPIVICIALGLVAVY